MTRHSLRHLRFFLALVDASSQTEAAARSGVTQPAIAQALRKLERLLGAKLILRSNGRLFLTDAGTAFEFRVRRAIDRLDRVLEALSPRLLRTTTWAQLEAVAAVAEARSFSEAARRRGLAQPTIHRAVRDLEREIARPLFDQTSTGLAPTRLCRALIIATRLALSEIAQGSADLAALDGREEGRLVVGALPLSRSIILPEAVARFRKHLTSHPVSIVEGTFNDLLEGLRLGDIDVLIGALRDPSPGEDVQQENLFDDRLSFLAAPRHPVLDFGPLSAVDLAAFPWVVPRIGTPARAQFDQYFADANVAPPTSIVDCGSILMMRELLGQSDMLGCISARQSAAEVSNGLLVRVPSDADWEARAIGMTVRRDWVPTKAQKLFLDQIRLAAKTLQD